MNEALSHFAEGTLQWLVAWSVVVTAVALVVHFSQPQRSSIRYAAWLVAMFAGLLLAPLMAGVRPRVAWDDLVGESKSPTAAATSQRDEHFVSWFKTNHSESANLAAAVPVGELRFAEADRSTAATGNSPSVHVNNDLTSTQIATSLLCAWLIGVALGSRKLLRGIRHSHGLVRDSVVATSADLIDQFNAAVRQLGLRRQVQLAIHPGLATPVCIGGRRAYVLWPAPENENMSSRERAAAIAHELAHLRRRDDWVNLAAEIWRIIAWFFPPVHWLIRRLRSEQEFMCDDVAAGLFERPQSYAQILLNLANVRAPAGHPCLAFTGPGLKGRIRRLLDARFAKLRPLNRKQAAALVLIAAVLLITASSVRLVGFAAQPKADVPPDAQLPTVTSKLVGEKMVESMKSYLRGYVEGSYEEQRDAHAPDINTTLPQTVHFPGRFRYASDSRRWRGEFQGVKLVAGKSEYTPRSWSAGFDGNVHFYLLQPENRFVVGEQINREGITLPELFWPFDDQVVGLLNGQFQDQETVGGYRCYSFVTEFMQSGKKHRWELVVSPRQGYLPVRYKLTTDGKVENSHELFDLAQTETGQWYPRRVKSTEAYANRSVDWRIEKFEPQREFGDAYFETDPPAGIPVIDYRNGYAYRNDPWWPEVKSMLRERFSWPTTSAREVIELSSMAEAQIDRQPAPPLSVKQWVQGGPVDLAKLRGKAVLLYFTDQALVTLDPKRTAMLKEIYSLYHPMGVEFVEIDEPTDDVAALEQRAKELEIPWPIALDTNRDQPHGDTSAAYRLTSTTSALLIDAEGKIRLVRPGNFTKTLSELLKDTLVDFTYIPPTENTRAYRDRMAAVQNFWQEQINNAPATAKITGKVTDRDGALSGAKVEAELRFALNDGPPGDGGGLMLGNTTVFKATQRFAAVSGSDGRFELSQLPKGNYLLTLQSPGRATIERQVFVTSTTITIPLEVELSQPDGILGTVLDEAGQPVAGASVRIESRYTNGRLSPRVYFNDDRFGLAISDGKGQFSFVGLLTGAYSLRASKDQLGTGANDFVDVGTTDVTITLDSKVPAVAAPIQRGPGRRAGRGAGRSPLE